MLTRLKDFLASVEAHNTAVDDVIRQTVILENTRHRLERDGVSLGLGVRAVRAMLARATVVVRKPDESATAEPGTEPPLDIPEPPSDDLDPDDVFSVPPALRRT